ncbi:MAG: hypothetical protein E6Q25_06720 [Acinetobacter sp.]|nr:MAG: hypothetical protein E6Q25_06720 [Acinetobacter sp.]
MSDSVVLLNADLVLTKEGFDDLVYETGTLLKVMMISNDHVVVKDDHERTFILKNEDKDTVWTLL